MTRAGARARHGAQERHDMGRLVRARARVRHGAQERHDRERLARAHARGRHNAQEFKKAKISKTVIKKMNVFAPPKPEWSLRSYPRGFSY